MGSFVELITYWAVLVPVSIMGFVSSLLIIWIWYGERYKFNRLIVMVLESFNCVYLLLYHLWRNTRSQPAVVYYTSTFVFSVRLVIVALHLFLSGMQYYWSHHFPYIRRSSQTLFVRKRIILVLVLVILCAAILRAVRILLKSKLPPDQKKLGSLIFHVVLLIFPQAFQLFFVHRMILNVLRRGRPAAMAATALNSITGALKLERSARISTTHESNRRQAILQTIQQLSTSPPSSRGESFKTDKVNGDFDPQIRSLIKSIQHEMNVTKAIIAISVPLIFVHPLGIAVEVSSAVSFKSWLSFGYAVWDILQFLNVSCHLCVFMAMLPTFRRSFKKRWSHLWNWGQTNKTGPGENSNTFHSKHQSHSFSRDSSDSSSDDSYDRSSCSGSTMAKHDHSGSVKNKHHANTLTNETKIETY